MQGASVGAKAIVWKAVGKPNTYPVSKHPLPACLLIIKGRTYIILTGSGRQGFNQVIQFNITNKGTNRCALCDALRSPRGHLSLPKTQGNNQTYLDYGTAGLDMKENVDVTKAEKKTQKSPPNPKTNNNKNKQSEFSFQGDERGTGQTGCSMWSLIGSWIKRESS